MLTGILISTLFSVAEESETAQQVLASPAKSRATVAPLIPNAKSLNQFRGSSLSKVFPLYISYKWVPSFGN
jgi:hypothetical protein